MKCRFFLLDINENRSAAKPTVRLWGLNDRGERVLILATQILPYFYYMPDEKDDPDSVRERLLKPGTKFTKILRIEIEKKKKLLGLPCNVLRITCSDSEVLTAYARDIRKDLGKGTTYEEDLRLSVRYVTDAELTLCGWQEFEPSAEVITEGQVDDSFFIIISGVVEVRKGDHVVGLLGAGDCFGEMGYLSKTERSATIVVQETVRLMKINSTLIDQVSVECQLHFSRVFLRTLVKRLASTTALLATQSS
jgi:CRP-like cAMP-binding protein